MLCVQTTEAPGQARVGLGEENGEGTHDGHAGAMKQLLLKVENLSPRSRSPSRTKATGETTFLIHLWPEVEGQMDQHEVHKASRASKAGKPLTDDEDFSAVKKSAMSKHASMTDGSFTGVGGAFAKQLAATARSAARRCSVARLA